MPVCIHCNNRAFVNEDALRQHLKSSSAHPLCTPCNRHFVNEKAYEAHMAARHPPTFDCMKCNRTFRSQSSLEDHYRGSSEHPNCNRCGKGFKNKRLMEEHYGMQHALVSYELDAHYLASDMHPSCLVCNCGFKDSESYKEHLVSAHENLFCALCTAYFESPETLSDHYLMSPRHPSCMACCRGFRGDQEFSAHLSSEHATSRTSVLPDPAVSGTAPVQRSSIPIRRPMIRVDSPALSLRPGFGSPIMEVKAPNFSPTILPPPGGIVDELWAMRENMEVLTPRRLTGTNGLASLADGTLRRKMEMNRGPSSLSSVKPERSPLNNLFVTADQNADDIYSQFKAFDHSSYEISHYSLMQESDPVVPFERGVKNEDSSKIVGMGIKDKSSGVMEFHPFSSPQSGASVSMTSSSPQSSFNLHSFASPTSSTSGSISSNDIPFVISSPVLSSFLQASERRNAERAPDLLLSTMATPIVPSPELELPNTIEGELLPDPKFTSFSPTDTSSPDVSSPLDLAALPCISPLATTPIERTSSLKSQNDGTFDFPESRYPLPDSPPFVPAQVVDPGYPSRWMPHSMELGLDDEISKDVISRPESAGLASNPEVLHIQTLTDSRHDTAEILVSSSPSPESAPTRAAELAKQEVSGQIPGHRALHCRLCQIDTCSDPTATMCGHMFCYKYVSFVSSPSNRGLTCSSPGV
ncbi:hypothetical protein F5887DRAFT_975610 [Amanita rubescens]|nr:hypothetical protein F5887DRAFT_975610 [Amanita rubescens]